MTRTRILLVWVLVQSALLFAVLVAFRHRFYQDDAFISLTYSRSLLEGKGLVWVSGERLEGYTSLAFVLLVALLGATGIDLLTASRLVGVGAGAAVVVAVVRHFRPARRDGGRLELHHRLLQALAGSLLLTSTPFVSWSFGGMEATLFALFLTLSTLAMAKILDTRTVSSSPARPAFAAALGLAVATLARPEGGLFWLVYAGFLVWQARRSGNRRQGWLQQVAPFVLGYVVLLAPVAAFKLLYYGELLPNTFYAKSWGLPLSFKLEQGAAYVADYVTEAPALVLFALALFVVSAVAGKRDPAVTLVVVATGVYVAYQATIGGDFMEEFRFFVPLIPLLVLALGRMLRALILMGQTALAYSFVVALLLASLLPFPFLRPHPGSAAHLVGRLAAPYIATSWPPGSTIAVNASGALPYLLPQYRYVDMLGLNDRHIARRRVKSPGGQIGHNKGDGAYVLARRPDYVLPGFPYGEKVLEPRLPGDRDLFTSPDFHRHYRQQTVELAAPRELRERLREVAERYPTLSLTRDGMRFTFWRRTAAKPTSDSGPALDTVTIDLVDPGAKLDRELE